MPHITMELSLEQIKRIVFQLPADELLVLNDMIEDRAQTLAMMQVANIGFREWEEEGEDIYDA
ncbi:hypothetical protein [Desulfoferrobacter suflitae]|uniref:hypothetical protein n=1 Tax=Desulfoferrobacter suflitae TaxID=2865782 RepID=UPI002164AA0A|nr:hypothetical protein [Desulfoferrobacter suflitae]MCK8603319.1 hypothetical protein [Desulfoferrobacter suflitae]